MHTGHNIRQAIAIFVTTTLLLNAMAPKGLRAVLTFNF